MTSRERAEKLMQGWDFDSEPDPNGAPTNEVMTQQIADAIDAAVREKLDMTVLKQVKSSNIHSVGYDEATRELAVRFKREDVPDDSVYLYSVGRDVAVYLMAAESIGTSFAKHVKRQPDGTLTPFRKVSYNDYVRAAANDGEGTKVEGQTTQAGETTAPGSRDAEAQA